MLAIKHHNHFENKKYPKHFYFREKNRIVNFEEKKREFDEKWTI